MLQIAPGWKLEVERGPQCLFVRLQPPEVPGEDQPPLAECLWDVLQQHFVNRLVLELDLLPTLPSFVIGQLVLLHKRLTTHGGLLRICGLSEDNQMVLRICQLGSRFPVYRDRHEAVGTFRPLQPR